MGALRVLHILPSLRPDGGERIAVYLVTGVDKRRFQPAVVSINEPVGSDLERTLRDAGIQVWYLGKKGGFDWRIYPKIHGVFREFRPDLVHTHLQVMRYALPSMIYWKPRWMLHSVQNVAEHELEWRARIIQRIAYRWRVVPIAVSREVARSVMRVYRLDSCSVVLNSVPTQLYRNPKIRRAEWRAAEGFGEEEVLFVCVARFFPQKNHALLLRAFAQGPANDGRARLILAGTGPLGRQLQAQAKHLGLGDRVRFLGSRTDIPELLAAMDVFVLSSDWEGTPVSLMEAMSAGLPVVATAVGGVPELFEDGREGFLVQPGDASGMAQAMLSLVHDRESRLSMGEAAALQAQRKFNVDEMVRSYEDIYERPELELGSGKRSPSLVQTPND